MLPLIDWNTSQILVMLPKFKQKRASEKLKTTDPEIYRLDFIDSPNNILYSFSLADQFGQK